MAISPEDNGNGAIYQRGNIFRGILYAYDNISKGQNIQGIYPANNIYPG